MADTKQGGLEAAQSDLDRALGGTAAAGSKERFLEEDYRVRIPSFEGPLDLLLHLIRKDQLNIYDIPITHICDSYLKHLEMMQQPDVNLAGEFMVMASTLLYLKSVMLLPREEGEEADEDPRKPLVAQLLELERFKKAAQEIDGMNWLNRDIYLRPVSANDDVMPVEALLDAPIEPIDTFQMLLCLKAALSRTTRKPINFELDSTSIKEKISEVTELLDTTEIVDFVRLLPEVGKRTAKDVVIAFLAMLELAKLKYIEILQAGNFGPIQIRGVKSLRELNVALLDQY